MDKMRAEIKQWLDANVWDGEDREGCEDRVYWRPDDLQELVEECISDVLQPPTWTPCAERLPTEADGDCDGRVWFSFDGEVTRAKVAFVQGIGKEYPEAHWAPTNLKRPEPPEGE